MENKNFDNLNDEELSELKDSLEETIPDILAHPFWKVRERVV